MVQVRQGIHSTNPKPQRKKCKLPEATIITGNTTPSHELNIKFEHISKVYTDDTGRFLIHSKLGNQYIMIEYNFDSNVIIAATFKSHADKHRLLAYGAIMQCYKDWNILVDLQILDDEDIT